MKPYHLLPEKAYASWKAYLDEVGGSAIEKARRLKPAALLEELAQSGLRGRGGAGFPTATKWKTIFQHPCKTRFVVCNAAEGEPGTYKDRYLLQKNPYAGLEGLLIASYVVQAKDIYIGIRKSFTKETKRLISAIKELEDEGLVDRKKFHLVQGPEEYLFGEEKALLRFIEEGSPLPREAEYPPYEKGLYSTPNSPNPALVNNFETFSHVANIIRDGAQAFRAVGTEDTPGTLLFTLCGDLKRPGVYERGAGITLRELLYEIAGGGLKGEIKCVAAGVSTGIIPAEHLDTPCDFAHLSGIGSGLGSAGFIAYDSSRNMVAVAQALTRFLYVESCNQCTACKYGLRIASHGIDSLFKAGEGNEDIFEQILDGAKSAPQGNRCYLPVEGATLVASFFEHFHEDFQRQKTSPTKDHAPLGIPLITDFDEAKHQFTYDSHINKKNPDWTYGNSKKAGKEV